MKKLINFILFQLVWLGFVVGAAKGFIWFGMLFLLILLAWQLHPKNKSDKDYQAIFTCIAIGLVISTMWTFSGLISYKNHWPLSSVSPWWIIALWVSFGATLNHSLQWMQQHKTLGVACTMVGGPVSYAAAARFGAVEIYQPNVTYVLIAIAWGLAMLVLLNLDHFKGRQKKGWLVNVRH